MDKIETQINATRTQLEIRKHELERKQGDENDLVKDKDRLEKLVEFKHNSLYGNKSVFPRSESNSNINTNNKAANMYKTVSNSTNNIRSNTPRGICVLFCFVLFLLDFMFRVALFALFIL